MFPFAPGSVKQIVPQLGWQLSAVQANLGVLSFVVPALQVEDFPELGIKPDNAEPLDGFIITP
jgi:hypothetical protein